mgnify:FL=1
MKIFGAGLTSHLTEDTTTLCYCWRIERADGAILGFTDHDRDLVVDGTTYLATTGITTTKMVQRLGLAVDNLEIEGAIDDDSLTTEDIERGLYDNAVVDIYIANWSDPTQFDLLSRGSFGNCRMVENGFEVEFRSLSQRLNQPTGSTYQRTCGAKLGDARCKFVVSPVEATVIAVSGNVITISATAMPTDWFSLGLLVDATGAKHKIKTHAANRLLLWETPVLPPEVGTTVVLTPGCRQTIEVCHRKFGNSINFQGFPHIPGNDALMAYPIRGSDEYDGGSLFK